MADHIEKIVIPDIGGAENVDVIEVLVNVGDQVNAEDSLITLEGDKATMEVPTPMAGIIENIEVKVGDKVSEGSVVVQLKVSATQTSSQASAAPADKGDQSGDVAKTVTTPPSDAAEVAVMEAPKTVAVSDKPIDTASLLAGSEDVLAGPAARRLAREVGVDLLQITGSGEKGRVTKEDVQQYVQQRMNAGGGSGLALPPAPQVDFSKFGEIDVKALSKIQKISGSVLHRNWVSIPHITQFGDADITEMEAFRQSQKQQMAKRGIKLTPLVFIMKAVVSALQKFPHFNASLDANGTQIILKKYFHVGVAVDTPNGLVVPVIRDVDQKGLQELAEELAAISKKARDTGLGMKDMQGGCFSISSLGGIGGTAFTPIINAPEVAILGVSRSEMKPVYQANGEFEPRLMLPLSLSYDHRVIDGADGARFLIYLAECLTDIRTLLL